MFAASKTASVSGGYQISRSLRFNSADSAYLNRTPASATNRKTWTYSVWLKRGQLTASDDWRLLACRPSSGVYTLFSFINTGSGSYPNALQLVDNNGTSLATTPVYRDPSAWYHIVLAVDTTQATAANRVRIYVNGTEVTAFSASTYPTQNLDMQINTANAHNIGRDPSTGVSYFDGYHTEINFVDGTQLTPSSFGETNAQTGVWQPKAYSGSYGTNGFYLNFSDNSNTTAATLGKDYSGNGNNWTPNNFSVTAGAGNDSLVDSPTSYGTDTGVGGEVRGNYCTLNPLTNTTGRYTVSNGNLQIVATDAYSAYVASTFSLPSSGKYYFEYVCTNTSTGQLRDSVGFVQNGLAQTYMGNTNTLGYDGYTGQVNGVTTGNYSTWGNGDVVGVAVDCDTGKVWVAKNNTWQNSGSPTGGTGQIATLTSITNWVPAAGAYAGSQFNYTTNGYLNFGQRPFAYTAPSGYKALCTQNLPTPTIGATTATQAGKYFNPVLYTGTGTTNNVTGVGFQPDFTWLKARSTPSTAGNHFATDVVRGAGYGLYPNLTDAEGNNTTLFTGFASDGFNLAGTNGAINENGVTYVAWNWKANGSGSTNTAGSITSTVSANTTSGFSIVTYAGNSTASTIGHGLGVAPSMIIVKNRTTNNPGAWTVYHASLGNTTLMFMNTADAAYTGQGAWNSTSPTSSVFSVGSGTLSVNNTGNNFVAYCFAEVSGYSKAFSYTGNGSTDGVFVYTGFRPAYVIVKCSSSGGTDWIVEDATRSTTNVVDARLFPNTSDAEISNGNGNIDFLSNGFKLRNSHAGMNASGSTYIGFAFASVPTKFSLAR